MGKHLLILVVGRSGSGKTTLVRELCSRYDYQEAISSTTRDPRNGEEEGVDYYFLSRSEFSQLVEEDGLYEYVPNFNGNSYGISKKEVDTKVEHGPTLLVVEPEGAGQMRDVYPGPKLFVSLEVPARIRRDRMLGRGDSPDRVERRLTNDAAHWPTEGVLNYHLYYNNSENGPTPAALGRLDSFFRLQKGES